MSDYSIFILYFIITIIIQCLTLCKAITKKDERVWSFFYSIFLGIILSSFLGTFWTGSFDADCSSFGGWGWFSYLYSSEIMIIISFIIVIIGFIIKLRLKKNNKNAITTTTKLCKFKIFFVTSITMLSLLSLTLVIPYQINLHNFRELESYSKVNLKNYLDNEYGKENYEIINFERDYSYNGIISKHFIGFEARIYLYNMKDYYNVYVNGKNIDDSTMKNEIIQRENLSLSSLN